MLLKTVKVMKDKERLSKCHRPEEAKGRELSTMCGLVLDPRPGKGWWWGKMNSKEV